MEELSLRQARRGHEYVIYLHLFAPGTSSDAKKEIKTYYLLKKAFFPKMLISYIFSHLGIEINVTSSNP